MKKTKEVKTVLDQDVEVANNDYVVRLTYIGEGVCGDYNKENPEDYPCIRADVYLTHPDEYDPDDGYIASTCTGEDARISVKEAEKYASKILKRFTKSRYHDDNDFAMAV